MFNEAEYTVCSPMNFLKMSMQRREEKYSEMSLGVVPG